MRKQNYKNHIRYYYPHHFIFYPLLGLLMVLSLYYCFQYSLDWKIWAVISALCASVIALSFMLRQHYALGNQNRLVVLEFRFRYFTLTGQAFEKKERELTFGQIAALRFAPDEEFLLLLERVLNEQLVPDVIKRSIKNWKADDMRL